MPVPKQTKDHIAHKTQQESSFLTMHPLHRDKSLLTNCCHGLRYTGNICTNPGEGNIWGEGTGSPGAGLVGRRGETAI
jgi:hypothetical protein